MVNKFHLSGSVASQQSVDYKIFAVMQQWVDQMTFRNYYHCVLLYSDTDECALNMDNCSELATCQNTNGSFYCSCNIGYHGDGFSCYG